MLSIEYRGDDVKNNGMLFKEIHETLKKHANRDLKAFDMTFSQLGVLRALSLSPSGRLSFKEIEAFIHVAQSTTVGLLSRMERKGIITCTGSDEDHRIKMASLTEFGWECCRQCERSMFREEQLITKGFSADERQAFHDMLERALRNLQEDGA